MSAAARKRAHKRLRRANKHRRRVPLKAAFTVKATKGAKK